jgi:hypothetical protein
MPRLGLTDGNFHMTAKYSQLIFTMNRLKVIQIKSATKMMLF